MDAGSGRQVQVQVPLLLLTGVFGVDAGVGEAGPDGHVEVEFVGQSDWDDGVGGDVRVVAAGQVAVAAGQGGGAGDGLAVGAGEGESALGGGDQVAEGVHDDVMCFA